LFSFSKASSSGSRSLPAFGLFAFFGLYSTVLALLRLCLEANDGRRPHGLHLTPRSWFLAGHECYAVVNVAVPVCSRSITMLLSSPAVTLMSMLSSFGLFGRHRRRAK
jgi:hypothetical protein